MGISLAVADADLASLIFNCNPRLSDTGFVIPE